MVGGETVTVCPDYPAQPDLVAEALPLHICHQDSELVVVDKPAGLVVHPGAGNAGGTLVNALLHYFPELEGLPRAGLIHRLDKDTTGLLVVARSPGSHKRLVAALQARTIHRRYLAVVSGITRRSGTVEGAIGRHPVDRKRMAVVASGKPARTHYRRLEAFAGHSLLQVDLETGRTHQIRVHMTHVGHPLVGDPVYGRATRAARGLTPALGERLRTFGRQALHARRLVFDHPATGKPLAFESPLPSDLEALIEALRLDAGSGR